MSDDCGLGVAIGFFGWMRAILCALFVCPTKGHKWQTVQVLWDHEQQCERCGIIK